MILGRHSAQARRYYHHVVHGGNLSIRDVARMVEAIEELEAELERVHERISKENSGPPDGG